MTRTGRTLNEYMTMGAAGLVALVSFCRYLPKDSALRREMDPNDETADWYGSLKTNAILADIFDVYTSVHTKKGRKAKPYPRPRNKKNIGRGAIPIKDFMNWWNGKE